MLIKINTNITAMAQDSIHVHNFHGHVKAREKMLFLEIIIVLWCLLTVETKIS